MDRSFGETAAVALRGDLEVEITRVLNGPRELVFDCWTKPELVKRWMHGPDDWELAVCELDVRVGGKLRFLWRAKSDGREMGMSGEYREVRPPERLVNTELFDEDWTGGETLVTLELEERDSGTLALMTIRYSSTDARDNALKTGMTDGMEQSFRWLDEVLQAMA